MLMTSTKNVSSDSPASMVALTRDLCAFACGVVSDDNEALFDRIGRELPLRTFRFRSGENHNGWIVPQNWRVKRAKLYRGGREVFDGTANTLGVARYSKSFAGNLSRDRLEPHLVTNADLPDAYVFHCMWQYRPWDADWAFSIPHRIYRELDGGEYRVELDTEYTEGDMLVAHAEVKGGSDQVVVFNSHTCHPHMANDGFAGTAVLIRLMQWLAARDNHYTYRLVLGPEHLGTVFYLRDLPREEVDRMVCGVFEEMPGTRGAIKAASTFQGRHRIDRAFANVLRHHSRAHELVPWRKGAGNDETVWEAPGYEVPFVEVTRCEDQFAPFREYHSSLDTPELMEPAQLEEMLEVMKLVVDVLEEDAFVQRNFDGLICLSNPKYDLYMERPDPAVVKNLDPDAEKWGHLLDCLFRYMDGENTVLDIAERHDLPFDRILHYLRRFEQKGLLSLARADIPRAVPKRVTRPNLAHGT
jgi:aminopeptidase-like protein